jgi:hypothetical protein
MTTMCLGAEFTLVALGCETGTTPALANSTSQVGVTLIREVQCDKRRHAGVTVVPKLASSGARVTRKRKLRRTCSRGVAAGPS